MRYLSEVKYSTNKIIASKKPHILLGTAYCRVLYFGNTNKQQLDKAMAFACSKNAVFWQQLGLNRSK